MSETVPGVGVQELFGKLRDGAVLVDVRESYEFVEVRATGARLVPLATVPDRLGEFPIDRVVYVICKSGGRSAQACQFLRANGVDAVNVLGGTLAWVDAELPVEVGEPMDSSGSANETSH